MTLNIVDIMAMVAMAMVDMVTDIIMEVTMTMPRLQNHGFLDCLIKKELDF
jgi:hypothetical protein